MTNNYYENKANGVSVNITGNSVWNFFKSVKLAVVVLILIAATSVIGTLIPQNGTEQFYIHKYGETLFKLLNAFDIFDMYDAWWFLLLLLMLSINIIVCSIDKLKTTWKIIFPDNVGFNIERFRHTKHKEIFESDSALESLDNSYFSFIKKSFGIAVKEKTENGVYIFGELGRWTRIGVYVVHFSILLMLVGAVIGGIGGFKAFVAIPEGDTVDSVFLRDNDTPISLEFKVRCNSFSVLFYDTGQPQEFKSNITIIEDDEDDKDSFTRDIVVNAPLRYKGLSFYQSSYGVDSAKSVVFKITSRESGMTYSQKMDFGQTVEIPELGGQFTLTEFVHGYNFQGHNLGEGFVGKLKEINKNQMVANLTQNSPKDLKEDTNKNSPTSNIKEENSIDAKEIYIPVKFPSFDKMRGGAFFFEIQDYEKRYYTGLQVTKDPGVWYVYMGFIFMIIGCWITFFMSHQSICIEIKGKQNGKCDVVISGVTNKNSQGMKLKIARIASKLNGFNG